MKYPDVITETEWKKTHWIEHELFQTYSERDLKRMEKKQALDQDLQIYSEVHYYVYDENKHQPGERTVSRIDTKYLKGKQTKFPDHDTWTMKLHLVRK